ncbi:MAG: UDP-N-acetylenolpyruvoylglucosamine reductase [Rickettsiales bacterium]|nr:UDP-N-acetylenolpyruvoylglucosamine reductase [Rickettsiales bacterium]|tara:strand:- start:10924 stop:11853 length:930 start_codon:yes stop_codon:yes gene_type:complete
MMDVFFERYHALCRFSVSLGPMVWFRVGGQAQVFFKPSDQTSLQEFISECPAEIPLFPLGVGSNLLIRDGGIKGIVIRLGKAFTSIRFEDDLVYVGAGALDRTVALMAAEQGLTGLEFLSGIPGTIGGAVKMNAGAYGSEVKDVFVSCKVITRQGEIVEKKLEDLNFTYRKSAIEADDIILEATFKAQKGSKEESLHKIESIQRNRALSQPIKGQTGGSTFKNPAGESAWKLIDQAGCRGLRFGKAQVSEKHCNFLLNTGGASAYEIETLAEEVRRRVYDQSKILLEWEIKRVGQMIPIENYKEKHHAY